MGKKGGPRVEAALRNPSYLRVANVIGISDLDSNNDVNAIEKYIRENGDPYENALKAATDATARIQAKSVQDLKNLTASFEQRIGSMNRDFNQRYADQEAAAGRRFKSLQDSANARYNNLNSILLSRTKDFNNQLAASQLALSESQDLYAEQQRLAANQANAFVPDANPSAQTATAGDDRLNLFNNVKPKKQQLNELSLLSGVGPQGNPLAGLQIA